MKAWPISADGVSLAVVETGAQLSDVRFSLADGRVIAPLHTAPWVDEPLPADTPPSLRVLRGDFLCAPFGDSDVIPGERRGHGLTANGQWSLVAHSADSLDLRLDGDVMGAAVTAHVAVRPGHRAIYQRHVFSGGSGRLPLGHHAMLRADVPLKLAFSRRRWAGTPPSPIETPPAGRSALAYPQDIRDLHHARLANGGEADITTYPFAEGHEDIWMIVADEELPFAWSAATASGAGWVWFAVKDPRVLPETVLWLSNGGRDYAPWSGRHRRVIGIEEVCSYFHLGHRASTADNPFAAQGIPTSAELKPGSALVVNYAFGVAEAPADFGAVADIRPAPGGLSLSDDAGHSIFAPFDLSHITGPSSRDHR